MNQTKKRLQIINIAISITDIETIQLQMLKLASLKSDEKLKEIMAGLQAQNYAQTQALITKYIETPTEEIVQRTSQDDREVIEEFDLFVTEPEEASTAKETELFDFDSLVNEPSTASKKEIAPKKEETIDFDNLLNLTADDIMPDNIEIDISHTPADNFFDTPSEDNRVTRESHIDTDFIPRDDFFDTDNNEMPLPEKETVKETAPATIETYEDILKEIKTDRSEEIPLPDTNSIDEPLRQTPLQREIPIENSGKTSPKTPIANDPQVQEVQEAFVSDIPKTELTDTETVPPSAYRKIPYIDQKLKNMLTQYPPLIEGQSPYDSVNNWLLKISTQGYTEEEVEEVLTHIDKLKNKNDLAQAAQLLLICGTTESKYAQFILARELFKGELLEKNLPEAFTLIHRLAMDDDYPEAICDLAQFYEKGVGIDKDRKRAESLYKEAMDLGVKRAATHYERLSKANKGLFGKLLGR